MCNDIGYYVIMWEGFVVNRQSSRPATKATFLNKINAEMDEIVHICDSNKSLLRL